MWLPFGSIYVLSNNTNDACQFMCHYVLCVFTKILDFWCFLQKKIGEIHSCLNRIHLNYEMILIDFFMTYSKVIQSYTGYTFQPHLKSSLALAYKSLSDCIAEY